MRYYESEAVGARVVILSEYAITRVDRPVYLNRVLRAEGLVQVRTENGGETLDCGECRAFALCDHQVCVCVCLNACVFVFVSVCCVKILLLLLLLVLLKLHIVRAGEREGRVRRIWRGREEGREKGW